MIGTAGCLLSMFSAIQHLITDWSCVEGSVMGQVR